jgi:hypothetical protein
MTLDALPDDVLGEVHLRSRRRSMRQDCRARRTAAWPHKPRSPCAARGDRRRDTLNTGHARLRHRARRTKTALRRFLHSWVRHRTSHGPADRRIDPIASVRCLSRRATSGLMHRSKLRSLVALLTQAVGVSISVEAKWRAAQRSRCKQPLVSVVYRAPKVKAPCPGPSRPSQDWPPSPGQPRRLAHLAPFRGASDAHPQIQSPPFPSRQGRWAGPKSRVTKMS